MTLPTSKTIDPKEKRALCEVWQKTLAHFGIHRGISMLEELEIARALQKWDFDFVELALFGARHEQKNGDFDPAKYISVRRVLGKDARGQDKADYFANIGAVKRAEAHNGIEAKAARAAEAEKSETRVPGPEASAKIREIMQGLARPTGRDQDGEKK
jgi:hypothetical protein